MKRVWNPDEVCLFGEPPAPPVEKTKAQKTRALIAKRQLPTIPEAKSKRDKGIKRVAKNAEYNRALFSEEAQRFIVSFLALAPNNKASGEDITDACVDAGIQPHDCRAFGSVFVKLVKAGKIEKTGETCVRKRGNLTTGGNIWRMKI